MKLRTVLGVALITLISAAAATAAPKHWHDDNDKHGKKHDEESCYFRQEDVRVIREYYEPVYRPLPPGLAKKY